MLTVDVSGGSLSANDYCFVHCQVATCSQSSLHTDTNNMVIQLGTEPVLIISQNLEKRKQFCKIFVLLGINKVVLM